MKIGLMSLLSAFALTGCSNLSPKPLPEWALHKNSRSVASIAEYGDTSRSRRTVSRNVASQIPAAVSELPVTTAPKRFESDWTGHENAVTDRLSIQTGICVSC